MTDDTILDLVLAADPPPFALLHRPEAAGADRVDVLIGELSTPTVLADVPSSGGVRMAGTGRAEHDVLVVVPYRQITERGYAAADDGAPLITLSVRDQDSVPLLEVLDRLPDQAISVSEGAFDVDDDTYAQTVREILAEEIGTGEGANFVIRRSFVADIGDWSPTAALTFFRRLLEGERGAYWTFVVHTGDRTFVGASPERHVSLHGGTAVMNPISGTYRYPATGPTLEGVTAFLADPKEADELYMVVDEELKMMAGICDGGGRVVGPYLKEMARLAHTEYFIEGRSTRDPREILRDTMFAPTVTGSPLESAAKVIAKYEPQGRGYYSGVLALIGRDAEGGPTLDSAIMIRTAEISAAGRVTIGVGATLVRDSKPESEVAETRAKASGLLAALGATETGLARHPDVLAALDQRNRSISAYWLQEPGARDRTVPALAGRKVLVVDAEDTFTGMLAHQLRSLGMEVTVRRFDEEYTFDGRDLVVLGPGPGDPRDVDHPKIAHLHGATRELLAKGIPFLSVCLSHQVLSTILGLDLVRRDRPNQGVQRKIDLFGRPEQVGFYNTFAARSATETVRPELIGAPVGVSRDPATGEVHGLRGPGFRSVQFHPESILTEDGVRIIGDLLTPLTAD
ncbi:chorismate-binding protein [Streptomyces sp. ISL-10]|uniref:anthranilate synthase family protein n=1 Tax=Streptomyces sp. ISL-10 TaxID=2819172 RepID=UPI001BEC14A6|nr:anthranilate synthase family protein [Streptomyces sp. ISL-10]MBT2369098.1 chorismate-binding protein [Streptomyces sp. ISL-10]